MNCSENCIGIDRKQMQLKNKEYLRDHRSEVAENKGDCEIENT